MTQVRTSRPATYYSTLGYIDTFLLRDEWKLYSTTRKIWEGASARAVELGYRLERFWYYEPGVSPARLSSILRARGITGLIVKFNPPKSDLSHRLEMDFSPFAVTTVETQMADPILHAVTNDQFRSTLLALNETAKFGYRRIGLVISEFNNYQFFGRVVAALLSFQQGVDPRDRVTAFVRPDERMTPEEFSAWLGDERPDALVAFGAECAILLKRLGIRVPKDIGLAHLDWDASMGSVAGVNQFNDAVGSAAVDLLTAHLQRNETGIPAWGKTVMLEGEWVPGDSLRRVRPRRVAAR